MIDEKSFLGFNNFASLTIGIRHFIKLYPMTSNSIKLWALARLKSDKKLLLTLKNLLYKEKREKI
jgi:hypothetical protein